MATYMGGCGLRPEQHKWWHVQPKVPPVTVMVGTVRHPSQHEGPSPHFIYQLWGWGEKKHPAPVGLDLGPPSATRRTSQPLRHGHSPPAPRPPRPTQHHAAAEHTSSPDWHGVRRDEEAARKARHGREDGGDAVGVAGLGHGHEGQEGYPGVIEREVEDRELHQHPRAVPTVGDHLSTVEKCT